MPNTLITEDLQKFLLNKEFVSVGTADLSGRPNAVPKFVIKVDKDFIYLGDYVKGTTFRNLKINPRVSISTIDMKRLHGWQINGTAAIITKGPQYKKLLKAMIEQEVHHSARRIIEDVQGAQKCDNYEIMFPEKVVIFKIKCESITRIGSTGKLHRQ